MTDPALSRAFEVILQRSELTLTQCPPDRSILSPVEEGGVGVLSSCNEGTCGACETRVPAGQPDHRDSVLRSAQAGAVMDDLMVNFGVEILKIVPGRISTEVDVRLSFDREGSIDKGRHLIGLYEKKGVPRERVLVKIAATWEGIQAAKQLQKESINCNLTVLFSFPQAVACAEAEVTTVAPYVGRICDWYKQHTGKDYPAGEDPGVLLVKRIYEYYRKFGYATGIMGASFRNTGEILELAGCDLLTINPNLLDELRHSTDPIEAKLTPQKAESADLERVSFNEKSFRFEMNEDPMATEKMAEAIRRFTVDTRKLQEIVNSKF